MITFATSSCLDFHGLRGLGGKFNPLTLLGEPSGTGMVVGLGGSEGWKGSVEAGDRDSPTPLKVLIGDFSARLGTDIGTGRLGELSRSSKLFFGVVVFCKVLFEVDGDTAEAGPFFSLSLPLPRSRFLSPRALAVLFVGEVDGGILSMGLDIVS